MWLMAHSQATSRFNVIPSLWALYLKEATLIPLNLNQERNHPSNILFFFRVRAILSKRLLGRTIPLHSLVLEAVSLAQNMYAI